MNSKLTNLGSGIILIGCILLAFMKPLETELGAQGQWALIGIILTLGVWIFRPFGVPFSAGAFFFAAYMLAIGIPAGKIFLDIEASSTICYNLFRSGDNLHFGLCAAVPELGADLVGSRLDNA